MELNLLHFAHPLWLLLTLLIPVIWGIYFIFYRTDFQNHRLEKHIDSHLLPYLLRRNDKKTNASWLPLILWSAAWALLTLALAGPRWDYREIEQFSKDQSLVILLDLSKSMNITDMPPSRLTRAKQKIEDILNTAQGVKIGLIAFAADPHMITPLTDDTETIRYLLPTLDTDLVHVQGSRLSSALDMAAQMLNAEPGNNKAILLLSDGGFEDASALLQAKKLGEKGIVIYAMGVGTLQGAPVKDLNGAAVKKNGSLIVSKLDGERLNQISNMARGRYFDLNTSSGEETVILQELGQRAEAELVLGKKKQLWDERFYLFILPALPMFLYWFQKRKVLFVFFFCFFGSLQASTSDYFRNNEQRGAYAYEQGKFEEAAEIFQDSYRKGVSCYKAGNYGDAEKLFRDSSQGEMSLRSNYNLGNALAQQQKFKEAITAYEEVLKADPDHTRAKENLELIKKLLAQKEKQQDNSDQDQQNDKDSTENSDKNKKDSKQEQKKNQDSQDSKDSSEEKPQDQKEQNSQQEQKKNQDSQDSKDSSEEKPQDQKEQNSQQEQKKNQDSQDSKDSSEEKPQDQKEKDSSESSNDKKEEPQEETDQKEEQPKEEAQPKKTESESQSTEQQEAYEAENSRSEEDQNADLWLNRISNDPKMFMKNKFYIESKKNGTTEGLDPW